MENNSRKINISVDDFKKKYPKLAKMTVAEVVATELFAKKLDVAIRCYKVANVYAFRSLKKDKTLELENFRKEYIACMDKESKLPYAKRIIILTIGNDAYSRTVKQMMEEYKYHFS